MMFHVYETKETVKAKHRPIIIITSNNEKELPAPFLRRCFFHFIAFPDEGTLAKIVESHYPELDKKLMQTAIDAFSALRDIDAFSKKPSTAELIDWVGLLMMESIDNKTLKRHLSTEATPIHAGALIKNEQDMSLLAKMANLLRY